MSELREDLAKLAHSQWSGWMDYMFEKCIEYRPGVIQAEDGALIIPAWAVKRWTKQAKTAYGDLSQEEKDSDRTEADKFMDVFQATIAAQAKEIEELKKLCKEYWEQVKAQAKEMERLKKIKSSLEAWLEAAQSADPKGGILVKALERTLTGE